MKTTWLDSWRLEASMAIRERIDEDIKTALRSGDKPRLSCLRMLKARLIEAQVAVRTRSGPEAVLGDEAASEVIATYAKQRRDSIESYDKGGRDDLAARERQELAVVNEYLPQQMSEDEVREIVAAAIAESGASSARDLGQVMKLVMPRVKGVADGALVNRVVRELLGA